MKKNLNYLCSSWPKNSKKMISPISETLKCQYLQILWIKIRKNKKICYLENLIVQLYLLIHRASTVAFFGRFWHFWFLKARIFYFFAIWTPKMAKIGYICVLMICSLGYVDSNGSNNIFLLRLVREIGPSKHWQFWYFSPKIV